MEIGAWHSSHMEIAILVKWLLRYSGNRFQRALAFTVRPPYCIAKHPLSSTVYDLAQ
jgi:hypothetical protein